MPRRISMPHNKAGTVATNSDEQQLLIAKQRLIRAERAGAVGCWEFTAGSSCMDWSEQMFRLFGVTEDSFTPTLPALMQLLRDADQPELQAAFDDSLAHASELDVTVQLADPGDNPRVLRLQATTTTDGPGTRQLVGTATDVTTATQVARERQHARRATTVINAYARARMASVNERDLASQTCELLREHANYPVVWIAALPLGDQACTSSGLRPLGMSGLAPDTMQAVSAACTDIAQLDNHVGQAMRTGEPAIVQDCENSATCPIHSHRAIEARCGSSIAVPLRIDDTTTGVLVAHSGAPEMFDQHAVELLTDVASYLAFGLLTLAERPHHRAVAAERERLGTAIEQSSDAIVITDGNGLITYVNPAFEHSSGYSAAEVLGQNPRILASGTHSPEFYREMWETITGGSTWSGRFVNKRKNGERYTEQATISPVRSTAGQIISFVAVKRDITEQLELQAQLTQAQRMESVGRLAGGIAHDFNNLLTVILGTCDIAMATMHSQDSLRPDIEDIAEAGNRAATLTRQLLAFSRRQLLQPVPLNLNKVISELQRMLRRLIGEDIKVATSLTNGLHTVKADPSQLEQVLMNLAVNARDAMPVGGSLKLETRNVTLDEAFVRKHPGSSLGPHVMMSVTDSGSGMDSATCERVFEPFFTTKEAGKGTGLGMSTVYGIIKQSGGAVFIDSVVGRGTTVDMYFPVAAEHTKVEQPRDTVTLDDTPVTDSILILEDDDMVRRLSGRVLRQRGYEVAEARDERDARYACSRLGRPFDLLLTDVVLRGASGAHVAKELASEGAVRKVLYMSGHTNDALVLHGVEHDEFPFLHKPFTPRALTRKVGETLAGGRTDPALQ